MIFAKPIRKQVVLLGLVMVPGAIALIVRGGRVRGHAGCCPERRLAVCQAEAFRGGREGQRFGRARVGNVPRDEQL